MSESIKDGGPVYPTEFGSGEGGRRQTSTGIYVPGMDVRTLLAGMAMQGLLSNPSLSDSNAQVWATDSVKLADALIKELGL